MAVLTRLYASILEKLYRVNFSGFKIHLTADMAIKMFQSIYSSADEATSPVSQMTNVLASMLPGNEDKVKLMSVIGKFSRPENCLFPDPVSLYAIHFYFPCLLILIFIIDWVSAKF